MQKEVRVKQSKSQLQDLSSKDNGKVLGLISGMLLKFSPMCQLVRHSTINADLPCIMVKGRHQDIRRPWLCHLLAV